MKSGPNVSNICFNFFVMLCARAKLTVIDAFVDIQLDSMFIMDYPHAHIDLSLSSSKTSNAEHSIVTFFISFYPILDYTDFLIFC